MQKLQYKGTSSNPSRNAIQKNSCNASSDVFIPTALNLREASSMMAKVYGIANDVHLAPQDSISVSLLVYNTRYLIFTMIQLMFR